LNDLDIKLVEAVRTNKIDQVKFYIMAGANINFQDKEHDAPLMWAAHNNNYKITKMLLEAGANVHVRTQSGYSVIFFVPAWCREVRKLLKQYGAEVHGGAY